MKNKRYALTLDVELIEELKKNNKYGLTLSKQIEILIRNYIGKRPTTNISKNNKKSTPEEKERLLKELDEL